MKILTAPFRFIKYLWDFCFGKFKYLKDKVNLIYYEKANFGDAMSPDIVSYFLNKNGLSLESKTRKHYTFLSACGSLFQRCRFYKKTVWGSGFLEDENYYKSFLKCLARLDIRCVRGPLTEDLLIRSKVLKKKIGIYGDPGLLAPIVYPKTLSKKYKVSVIPHFKEKIETDLHVIKVSTRDWRSVVDEIVSSELVISSSLHGIIVAEAYGVPAIWLHNEQSHEQVFKYLDYYASTGRSVPIVASSIGEALKMEKPVIPNLDLLTQNLINSFPLDLWIDNRNI